MKIIRVVICFEIDCIDCLSGTHTYGYYDTNYDIRKVILSILNERQDWDLDNIYIDEVTLNVSNKTIIDDDGYDEYENNFKDIREKYMKKEYDEHGYYEWVLRD